MSQIFAPFGRVPAELVKTAHVVSLPNETKPAPEADVSVKATFSNKSSVSEKELMEAIRAGKAIDIRKEFTLVSSNHDPVFDRYTSELNGKTIVDNSSSINAIKLESRYTADGQYIYTASDAGTSAALGAPTHSFFYEDVDFLMESAKEYAKLGENEGFQFRGIHDVNFVRNTLDFFTNGNYTARDVASVQNQMTDVVRELAQQLKNGESPDLDKLQTKLTIGGTDVTIGELIDFQNVGKDLVEGSFGGVSVGSLSAHNTAGFAKIGIGKAIGDYYGSDKGEIGKMFSDGIGRLAEKAIASEKKSFNQSAQIFGKPWITSDKDAMDVCLEISDLFSNLDSSSKGSLSKDFSSKLSSARSVVQNYCNKYGMPTTYVGLASATDDISKYFQSWLNKI